MKISVKRRCRELSLLSLENKDEKQSLETFKSNWHEIIQTSLFSNQHILNENIHCILYKVNLGDY